jgi:hypothetical protein
VTGPAGYPLDLDFLVLRLLPDGSLDDSFDGDGVVVTDVRNVSWADVAFDSAGGIVVGGIHLVARYLIDGSLDPSFGRGGISVFSGLGAIEGVAITPDGNIQTVGNSSDQDDPGDVATVARILGG